MKEITDGIWERIKSPFFGYLAISFISFNWEELYYLFFSNQSAALNIDYFHQNSTFWSLIICPVSLGIVLTALSPWVNLFFFKLTWKANNHINTGQAELQNETYIIQAKLEENRSLLKSQRQQEIIDDAKVDAELNLLPEKEKNIAKNKVLEVREGTLGYKINTPKGTEENIPENVIKISELDMRGLNLLKYIVHNQPVTYQEIISNMKYGEKLDFYLGDLRKRNLVEHNANCYAVPLGIRDHVIGLVNKGMEDLLGSPTDQY